MWAFMSPQTKISQSAGTTAMCSCKTLDIPSRKYRDFSGTVYTWLIWISLSILNNYFFRTTQNTTSSRFCCTIIPCCSSQRTKRPIPPECHFARGCLCFGESLCIRIPLNQIDYFHPSMFRTRIYHQTVSGRSQWDYRLISFSWDLWCSRHKIWHYAQLSAVSHALFCCISAGCRHACRCLIRACGVTFLLYELFDLLT